MASEEAQDEEKEVVSFCSSQEWTVEQRIGSGTKWLPRSFVLQMKTTLNFSSGSPSSQNHELVANAKLKLTEVKNMSQ